MELDDMLDQLKEEYYFNEEEVKEMFRRKESNLYDLKSCDKVFVIFGDGDIRMYSLNEDTFNLCNQYVINGNAFKTELDAKIELQKRQVEFQLKKYAFKPNLENENEEKWLVAYNESCDCAIGLLSRSRSYYTIYFESESLATKAIREVGCEKIKCYLKGILYNEAS